MDHEKCPIRQLFDTLISDESPIPVKGKTVLVIAQHLICMAAKDKVFFEAIVRAVGNQTDNNDEAVFVISAFIRALSQMGCLREEDLL